MLNGILVLIKNPIYHLNYNLKTTHKFDCCKKDKYFFIAAETKSYKLTFLLKNTLSYIYLCNYELIAIMNLFLKRLVIILTVLAVGIFIYSYANDGIFKKPLKVGMS